MMLLDTHALIWWVSSPKKIPAKARNAIERVVGSGEALAVSCISIWEVAMLVARVRLTLTLPADVSPSCNSFRSTIRSPSGPSTWKNSPTATRPTGLSWPRRLGWGPPWSPPTPACTGTQRCRPFGIDFVQSGRETAALGDSGSGTEGRQPIACLS